jgi:hypothetical protein
MQTTRTLVVADANSSLPVRRPGTQVVRTPLDLVLALDAPVARVVLLGSFARDASFAAFVRERCPEADVVRIHTRQDERPLRAVA